jgi:hypothetical protein
MQGNCTTEKEKKKGEIEQRMGGMERIKEG